MTVLADVCCLDVRWALAGSIATIVAGRTVVCDIDVIEIGRCPGNRGVAIVAVISAGDMSRVLAYGRDSVMAATACADNLSVINSERRHPGVWRMTVLTHIGALYVRWGFAGRIGAVMTIKAIAGYIDVVKIRR